MFSYPYTPNSESADSYCIWDTGATNTCISKRVAEKLGLIPNGKENVYTAGGEIEVDIYVIDIILPGNIFMKGIEALCVDLEETTDVLVGMDIICQGDFIITNTDKQNTSFTFRIPDKCDNEKIPVLQTHNYLEERAKKGDREAFRAVLDKVPDVPAPDHDQ